MKLVKKILLVYALLVIIGGIVGYVKADSPESIIAGVICGALLFYSRWLWGQNLLFGFILGLFVSLALLGRFAGKAFSSEEGLTLWPGGVIIFFSVVTIVVLIATFLQERKNPSGQEEAPAEEEAAPAETGEADATTTTTTAEEAEESSSAEEA